MPKVSFLGQGHTFTATNKNSTFCKSIDSISGSDLLLCFMNCARGTRYIYENSQAHLKGNHSQHKDRKLIKQWICKMML